MSAQIDIEKLLAGDVLTLSKAITLVESTLPDHRKEALQLIDCIYAHRTPSTRIGITGIPGVGKSTFIESLGRTLLQEGKKLAVLAVDPSSNKSGGSILGDKTRMEELSREQNAFIRPSPTSGTLGGVAARTRESMLLCEAAGFDAIIVETVGVGQSETEVINITDCFLMLAMPGTGDDLQGIKRGIMEAADIIVINKADGSNIDAARKAKKQLQMALHLFPSSPSGWETQVLTASGLNDQGVMETWLTVKQMMDHMQREGHFEARRREQQRRAFEKLTELSIFEYVMQKLGRSGDVNALIEEVNAGTLNEFAASLQIIDKLGQLTMD
ncbi:MAG: methylmalonyl Co-A mutase-associated GTPase MeaB [Flavobacteriales bacterium]|nr:methylmalonyl Co-A mutase-associated GTPase MeaB [Flavobacteriales bacterium]